MTPPVRPPAGHADHAVQFYGDDAELSRGVTDFLGPGLAEGGSAIVLATPGHREALAPALEAKANGGAARAAGWLLMTDAAGMLDGFLTGDQLDPARFRAAAEAMIRQVARAGEPVRIYAEMVALLWDAGQVTLAIELEALWNDLAARLPFALLCGYPARVLTRPEDAGALESVRCLHARVLRPYAGLPAGGDGGLPRAEATQGFPAVRDSARQARHFVQDQLHLRVGRAVAVDAAIVAAELAANAMLHARSAFTVTVSQRRGRVRISVRDAMRLDDGEPLVASLGHGLDVVTRLAARWAIEPLPDGKVIWAELAVSPRGEG